MGHEDAADVARRRGTTEPKYVFWHVALRLAGGLRQVVAQLGGSLPGVQPRTERRGGGESLASVGAVESGSDGLGYDYDLGATRFRVEGTPGDDTLGGTVEGAGEGEVELDGASRRANQIVVFSTRIEKRVTARSDYVSASSMTATTVDGHHLDAGQTGVRGMTINIYRPLSGNYVLDVHVDGLSVKSLHYKKIPSDP